MIAWIAANYVTVIALAAVAALIAAAISVLVRDRKKGGGCASCSGCSGCSGCGGCPMGGSCQKRSGKSPR